MTTVIILIVTVSSMKILIKAYSLMRTILLPTSRTGINKVSFRIYKPGIRFKRKLLFANVAEHLMLMHDSY